MNVSFSLSIHTNVVSDDVDVYVLLQAKQQLRRLQQQMQLLTEERDAVASALEAKESQLLGLHAQVDLLRNHNSETEDWLTSM